MSQTEEMVGDDAPITASKAIKPDAALSAEAVTIGRSPDELFSFWRDVTNLAAFSYTKIVLKPGMSEEKVAA